MDAALKTGGRRHGCRAPTRPPPKASLRSDGAPAPRLGEAFERGNSGLNAMDVRAHAAFEHAESNKRGTVRRRGGLPS